MPIDDLQSYDLLLDLLADLVIESMRAEDRELEQERAASPETKRKAASSEA